MLSTLVNPGYVLNAVCIDVVGLLADLLTRVTGTEPDLCGSTRNSSTFLKYSYNLWVMYSYSYSIYSDFTSTLRVHLNILRVHYEYI